MTSDGIPEREWGILKELAVNVANVTAGEDEVLSAVATNKLLLYLDELERLYGPKPSILATRADYVDSGKERETLLLMAFGLAEKLGDNLNSKLIAGDLAGFYRDLGDERNERKWRAIKRKIGNEPQGPL